MSPHPQAPNSLPALFRRAADLPPVRCAVVHPCDHASLDGVMAAVQHGLLEPVLVGPKARIEAVAAEHGFDIAAFELVDEPFSHAAAERAALMAARGDVEALMKGSLHTDELMHAILRERPLRMERRMSHVFHFDLPAYDKPILITDAALNIMPTLRDKADITQNAIDLARILGVETPKVALLSAVETVNPDIQSTIDAAALCKMADRKQITGGLLDGPLAFDNAVSPKAVAIKGIDSPVAGQADILVVPDLEAGNMLAKQLEYFGNADSAGIVMGARVPIALTSRADATDTRLASVLLVQLVAHHYRQNPP
ncbi:phosphotransacetylase [Neisseria sp. HSC-16F19]|nr:bifunctional enoyl-CoA hydratase/phosphate acetyltransferase [Neisseria sp. HSC-16F19]MCP2040601.1 phosphotransacetylase [Neisseria sp. HSC-16F19]